MTPTNLEPVLDVGTLDPDVHHLPHAVNEIIRVDVSLVRSTPDVPRAQHALTTLAALFKTDVRGENTTVRTSDIQRRLQFE